MRKGVKREDEGRLEEGRGVIQLYTQRACSADRHMLSMQAHV